jgi:16S rRNA (guanine966-N2)-methyltransferase
LQKKKVVEVRRTIPNEPLKLGSRGSVTNPGGKPGTVRIIGGQWKRTPLTVVSLPGLRPTPDRVRETLFNWIGPSIKGLRCLDLFAGTGALGLEAASRGAAQVTLVEASAVAVQAIEAMVVKLKAQPHVHIVQGTALHAINRLSAQSVDLVFLDPPFGQGWLTKIIPELPPLLAQNARIYVEADEPWDKLSNRWPTNAHWQLLKAEKAGQVYYHLVQYCAEPT